MEWGNATNEAMRIPEMGNGEGTTGTQSQSMDLVVFLALAKTARSSLPSCNTADSLSWLRRVSNASSVSSQ